MTVMGSEIYYEMVMARPHTQTEHDRMLDSMIESLCRGLNPKMYQVFIEYMDRQLSLPPDQRTTKLSTRFMRRRRAACENFFVQAIAAKVQA
jgi:hypothetical protein